MGWAGWQARGQADSLSVFWDPWPSVFGSSLMGSHPAFNQDLVLEPVLQGREHQQEAVTRLGNLRAELGLWDQAVLGSDSSLVSYWLCVTSAGSLSSEPQFLHWKMEAVMFASRQ